MEYSFIEALNKILQVSNPWQIGNIELNELEKKVDVYIDYSKGSQFACPVCKKISKIHDSSYRQWRHLDICDYRCYLHIKIPRTNCPAHGVKVIKEMDFGRINTHFSFKFEQLIMSKVREMSVSAIAKEIGEVDTTIWSVLNYYIPKAIAKQLDLSATKRIGVDETSNKPGHSYTTIFTDSDTKKVIFVTQGKDQETFGAFYQEMFQHMGEPNNIEQISMDMSKSFIAGKEFYFPTAEVVFDRFHIKKGLNEAIDTVRKQEVKSNESLKETKYIWLKNEKNLTEKQKKTLGDFLKDCSTNTAKAYSLKNGFDELWKVQNQAVEPLLEEWCKKADALILAPVNKFVKTLKNHWKGVLNSITTQVTNAFAEGLNSIVQLVKSRARGFRNHDNFKNMIYLLGNDLNFTFH